MSPLIPLRMEPLELTYDERECLLRAARRGQQEIDAEMYRLTEMAKGGSTDATNAREIVSHEFACVTCAIAKLWRLHAAKI